ncbi:MAG: hypothetical protein ACKOYN_12930, partial [Planctomycetota bacterium]
MLVLHAVWTRERLHVWAEDSTLLEGALAIARGTAADGAALAHKRSGSGPEQGRSERGETEGARPESEHGSAADASHAPLHASLHAFAADAARLRAALVGSGLLAGDDLAAEHV